MKLKTSLKYRKTLAALGVVVLSVLTSVAFATEGDLGQMADNLSFSVISLTPLIGGIGYLIGLVFLIMGIMHFKKHKDGPHQTALSVPIVLVSIGASLVFLPSLINSTGSTLFGEDKQMATSVNGYLDPNSK